jgi:hypothetical protein
MLQDRLILRSAICLQPLTAAQIDRYFEQAGDRLSALKAVLPQDAELQELAKSPLMLSVMSLAYQDFTLEQLTVGGKIEDYRQRLFATYIDRMFQRRGTTQLYSREDSQRWLIWLAQKMTHKAQTIFLIERLQPNWLSSKGQRISYRLGSGCLSGLIFILITMLSSVLITMLSSGMIYGLGNGIIYGLIYGLWISVLGDIQPVETLKWSWQKARNSLKVGFILGFIFFLIYLLTKSLMTSGVIVGVTDMLLYVLNYGLLGGLIGCLIGGFRGAEIHQSEKVNQGIFRSAQNAIIISISLIFIFALIVSSSLSLILSPALSLSMGLASGLVFGPIGGLVLGGNAAIRHFALRLFLYEKRYAPWKYARFLDYATERLFLQKVGGGYIFVHRMLLEHFAEMSIEQGKR